MKTIIVMPAYNAERTLEKTISDIPFDLIDEIILVDDFSQDKTLEVARSLSFSHSRLTDSPPTEDTNEKLFTIVPLPQNRGYGGNQKECYKLALKHKADIIIMLHPDFQYDPKMIKSFIESIKEEGFDFVIGSRIRSLKESLRGGMPFYKHIFNKFLSFIENAATGKYLSDWHSGMRAYKREVLLNIDFQDFSDDFVFDSQMLFNMVKNNYAIKEIPIPIRYFKDSSSIDFWQSLKYGLQTLKEAVKFIFI